MKKSIRKKKSRKDSKRFSDHNTIEEKLQLALEHHSEGRLNIAAKLYQEVLHISPGNTYACFNLGIIRHSRGELEKAITCYREVLKQKPDHFQVLFNLGNAYRDKGLYTDAARVYRRALEQEPGDADTHYNMGSLYQQQDRYSEARNHYQQTLSLDPDHFHAVYNLGIIHFKKERYEEAASCYRRALRLCPDDTDTCFNLGLTLLRVDKLDEAAASFERALSLAPDDPELYTTLGNVFLDLTAYEKAEQYYRKALELRPDYGAAHTNLAIVLHLQDDYEGAARCYRKAVELGHDVVAAEYLLAALTDGTRKKAPREYVERLFDKYAENFERNLTRDLDYDVPEKLRELFDETEPRKRIWPAVVDLGCGTGLVGRCFRDVAGSLVGVDISVKMLEKAEEKGGYDDLYVDDIVEFLDQEAKEYDLLLAADVMIYLGDLEPLMGAAARASRPGALFLFSVEKCDGEGEYVLRRSGRFAYSRQYIEKLAQKHGFTTESCRPANIRKHKEKWIPGYLFALRRGKR